MRQGGAEYNKRMGMGRFAPIAAFLCIAAGTVAQVDLRVLGTQTPARNSSGQVPATPVVGYGRILPVGDSITAGTGFVGGYRKILEARLKAIGVRFTYVGRSDPYHPMDMPFHEGHSGWTTTEILEGRPGDLSGDLEGWMKRYKPDTVLLMAGTNDKDSEPARQIAMLATIFRLNPRAKVVVGLVPLSNGGQERTKLDDQKRASQVAAVDGFARLGYSIALADTVTGFNVQTMLSDPVHPNEAGYQAIAKAFQDGLKKVWGF